jgi:hypothetical protein
MTWALYRMLEVFSVLSMITPTSNRRFTLFLMPAIIVTITMTGYDIVYGGEEDDLQRQIDAQRADANDIEHLDQLRVAPDDIAFLKACLDEAWNLRAKHDYDQVREVLDRALAQAEYIRQKIAAAKLRALADQKSAVLRQLRLKIDEKRQTLKDVLLKKKALEDAAP